MPAFFRTKRSPLKGARKGRSSTSRTVPTTENTFVLLDEASKPEHYLSPFEKITMIKQGISKSALELFKRKTGLDYDQLAAILSVARATLINKKGNAKFNQTLSEKILGLADIYSYGYEVFGDQDKFNEWIFRPNRSLAGQTPYDLLDNQYGRDEVKNIIGRIDFGVYS